MADGRLSRLCLSRQQESAFPAPGGTTPGAFRTRARVGFHRQGGFVLGDVFANTAECGVVRELWSGASASKEKEARCFTGLDPSCTVYGEISVGLLRGLSATGRTQRLS